jgi:hypothetical protein
VPQTAKSCAKTSTRSRRARNRACPSVRKVPATAGLLTAFSHRDTIFGGIWTTGFGVS